MDVNCALDTVNAAHQPAHRTDIINQIDPDVCNVLTPEAVRPFPKAVPRKQERKQHRVS